MHSLILNAIFVTFYICYTSGAYVVLAPNVSTSEETTPGPEITNVESSTASEITNVETPGSGITKEKLQALAEEYFGGKIPDDILAQIPPNFNISQIIDLLGDQIPPQISEALPSKTEEIEEMIKNWVPVSDTDKSFIETSCNLDQSIIDEIASYQSTVDKIIDFVMNGPYKGKTYQNLADLVDTFGPRMTGSDSLSNSIEWIVERSKEEGLENIHKESFMAPHWVRNNESLWLVSPRVHKLNFLSLGSSVGTPPEGITAEVFVVDSFDDLEKQAKNVAGKIVVFNAPFTTYGETVKYRSRGASKAAEHGAVASLIRSITPESINSPHTGQQYYSPGVKKIPTACITIEDAAMMARMQKRGQTVKVQLVMGAENFPEVETSNTIAEVVGTTKSDEVVVIGGHLDSWDVGQGAMDDGGGAIMSWTSAIVLQKLGLKPKRTVRTVLFSAEEQGIYGGLNYFRTHVGEKEKFQLLLESDIGTFDPLGIAFSGSNASACIIHEILKLTKSINTTNLVTPMDGGPDIEAWSHIGVPTGSLSNANSKYFWYHHSNGDMMTVLQPSTLDKCTAMWASVAFVTADISMKLP